MRPVRFVALSEDGQALVLADEVGRLLALPIDERVSTALRSDPFHIVFDRPFTWAVEHAPSGTILFLGRVLNPTERSD